MARKSKPLYMSYYREDKTTHQREYLRTNLFSTPAIQWTPVIEDADKYSCYDAFLNNAKTMNLLVDEEKYDYDFEEVA